MADDKELPLSAAAGFCKAQAKKLGWGQTFGSAFSERTVELRGGDPSLGDVLFSPKGHQAYSSWLHTLPWFPGTTRYWLRPLHLLVEGNTALRSALRDYLVSNAVPLRCRAWCPPGTLRPDTCSCSCHGHRLIDAHCCPKVRGVARLNVTVVNGEGLLGDGLFFKTDGYVKVFYGKQGATSRVIWNNDFPIWNFLEQFRSVDLTSRRRAWIEVWDRDSGWDDDLLGKVSLIPKAGKTLGRYQLKHGSVRIRTAAVCGPSLQGELCEQ